MNRVLMEPKCMSVANEQELRRWMRMKQSMKVDLNQVSFYDRLSKLIANQKTHLKSVSVRRYPSEAVVTIESDNQFVLSDEPKNVREWEKESFAGTADFELLTICLSNSAKSFAL